MKKLIFSIILSILLTGCFDKVELEERSLVLAVGIDKYEKRYDTNLSKTDEEKRYIISMSMPEVSETENEKTEEPKDLSTEQEKKAINGAVKKGEGISISSTMDLIDTYTSKNLYYGHTKVVILGGELLKDADLLKETIDTLERHKQISRKLIIMASKSNAQSILEAIPKDEKMIGIYINDFYKQNNRNSAFTFRVDLEDIIQQFISNGGDTAIPLIDILGEDVRIGGLAVIDDYKLVEYLNDRQTKGLLWIMDKNSLGEIAIPFEDTVVSLDIFNKTVDMRFLEKSDKIICSIDIDIKGNIAEYKLNNSIIDKPIKYDILEREYEQYLKNELLYSLESITSLNADILNIRENIRKKDNSIYKKYNLKDKNIYDYITFDVNTTVKIKGSGSIK